MLFYYFLALLAAFSWSIASLISTDLSREIGSISFNRLRLIFVSIMLITFATFQNSWDTINYEYLNLIILSGIVGVFLGDTFLFMALKSIGPRRNNILFSLAAPFTVILNIFFLNQNMEIIDLFACILIFIGVVIAISYGDSKKNTHRWETIEGSIGIGIILGILAALCQAIGLIIMKPILTNGVDPIASAAIRTTISAFLLSLTWISKSTWIDNNNSQFNIKIILKTILSGFLGMALGMSLLLIALQNADAGIVATLSSTGPIMILFLIWIFTKRIPSIGSWFGTILAILGTSVIFIF